MTDTKRAKRTKPYASERKEAAEDGGFAMPKKTQEVEQTEPAQRLFVRLKNGREYEILGQDGVYLYCEGTQIRHGNPAIDAVFEKKEG